ncbi:MAG: PASTA domain-containing protein, partial [Stackebrandtia sp.]
DDRGGATVRMPSQPRRDDNADTRSAPAAMSERPRRTGRKRRVLVVAGTLAVLAVAGGIAAAGPWNDDVDPDTVGSEASDNTEEELLPTGNAGSTVSPTSSKGMSPGPAESESESDSDEPSDDSGSSSSSPSDDPTSSEPTGTVPDLIGASEADAFAALESEGFTNTSSYKVGAGEHQCHVVEQDPEGGSEHRLDDAVEFGVLYAENAEQCQREAASPVRAAASPIDD